MFLETEKLLCLGVLDNKTGLSSSRMVTTFLKWLDVFLKRHYPVFSDSRTLNFIFLGLNHPIDLGVVGLENEVIPT